MQRKYLIISPCYNIEKFAQRHIEALNKGADNIDVLLIDDCSSDDTLRIIKQSNFKIEHFSRRRGKARALKYGFEYASDNKYDAVITIDSDLQHDHNYINEFIKDFESGQGDYLIGKRKFSISQMPLSRIFSNFLSSKILSKLSGFELKDSQCGFRLIDAQYYSLEVESDGFQFESEHLVKSAWLGARISHINIPTVYNGALSSMKYVKDTFKFIRLFIRLAWNKKIYIQSLIEEQV